MSYPRSEQSSIAAGILERVPWHAARTMLRPMNTHSATPNAPRPPKTSSIEVPRPHLGAVLRAVSNVARPEDWDSLDAWAKVAGIGHVAEVLATFERELSERPMSRGAWSLALANPDPNRTGRSAVSPK